MLLAESPDVATIANWGLVAVAVAATKGFDLVWPKLKEVMGWRRLTAQQNRDEIDRREKPIADHFEKLANENEFARKEATAERDKIRQDFLLFREEVLIWRNEMELYVGRILQHVEHLEGRLKDKGDGGFRAWAEKAGVRSTPLLLPSPGANKP